MIRYQERLKTYLLRREENLNIKLREADNELKVRRSFSSPCHAFDFVENSRET